MFSSSSSISFLLKTAQKTLRADERHHDQNHTINYLPQVRHHRRGQACQTEQFGKDYHDRRTGDRSPDPVTRTTDKQGGDDEDTLFQGEIIWMNETGI